MLHEPVPIAAAGGVDDPEHPLGTDVGRILQAIESVYSDDGVLVLMDMGSAILSTETALELLDSGKRKRIRLSEAPVVEGACAAAIASEAGGNLEDVAREARESLVPKEADVGGRYPGSGSGEESQVSSTAEAAGSRSVRVFVSNPLGIHARPAAKLVSTASRYHSDIRMENLSGSASAGMVSAKSINGVSLLGVRQGQEIALYAHGPDADEALGALKEIIESGFGEGESTGPAQNAEPKGSVSVPKGGVSGIPASPGVSVGPCVPYQPRLLEIAERTPGNPAQEWSLLRDSMAAVGDEIRKVRVRVMGRTRNDEASIFEAHLLFLEDEELLGRLRHGVFEGGMAAEAAWAASVDELIAGYERLDSPYLRARAADLEDLKRQVLRMLLGESRFGFSMHEPGIVVAPDLSPTDVGRLDGEKVLGICTAYGGPTSHSAILARALGIPAVVGLGPEILRLPGGTIIGIDGERGLVSTDPDELEKLGGTVSVVARRNARPPAHAGEPAVTLDGRRIPVLANIGEVREVETALLYGAEGVGVLRTEFLFSGRLRAPGEDEQAEVYGRIAKGLEGRPLVIRALDAGGDKPLAFLPPGTEQNPSLGLRGMRLLLEHPGLFMTQVRAVLRCCRPGRKPETGAIGKGELSGKDPEPDLIRERRLSVLLPMVSTIDEIRLARDTMFRARDELLGSGIPLDEEVGLGMMIEVPSSALLAYRLAQEVDFLSIGTNDLTQYIMSADRTNSGVSSLCDALHPAVLHAIDMTARAGHDAGRMVGVCGEIAGNRRAAPLLLGLGVDELSMNPLSIPEVKRSIAEIDTGEAGSLAKEALAMNSAGEVRNLLEEFDRKPESDTP
jgi:phosphocarrier protein FPr